MNGATLHWRNWAPSARPRLSVGPAVFASAALLTLLPEIALAERKYGIFGGGFGSSRTLDGAGEIVAFAAALLASHLLLLYGLFRLMRRLHGKRDEALFYFNFLFLVPGLVAALLAAKFKVLSYFSDAISFQVIRNLGGGSLFDALRYALSEAGLVLIGLGGGLAAYLFGYGLFRHFWPKGSAAEPAPRLSRKSLLIWLLAVPLLVFGAKRVGDAGSALGRFNAFSAVSAALGALTDVDGDGYSLFSTRLDSHAFDPTRHPLALDVPGNGIDEDGYGGDLVFDRPDPVPATPRLTDAKHLVLIVLESTRGDLIGQSVGGVPVSPNISRIAAEGTLAREAYSHVGFTTESLKSLFTGRLVPDGRSPTLFRDLDSNGYRIGVLSGQSEQFGDISETVGMRRHSDVFVDAETLKDERAFGFAAPASLLVDGQLLLREFDRNFGGREGWQRPTFLYMNFQSAHFPYHNEGVRPFIPGEPIPRSKINIGNKEWVARTYWNSVAYGDWLVGQVVARLKRLGVYENSLVIVTADHGESLFDDGFLGHGHMINRQQTHIPLVTNVPGADIPQPIGLSDMRGLILSLLGASGAAPPEPARPVFQYIGTLDRPGAIGTVSRGADWVTLNLDTEEVVSGGRSADYRDLAPGDPLKARADALVQEWARQRWIAHLERSRG